MSIKSPAICLCFSIAFAALGFGAQQQPDQLQQPLRPAAPVVSTKNLPPEALKIIKSEIKQVVEDIKVIDAGMYSKPQGDDTLSTRIHQLLQKENLETMVGEFLEATQDQALWESCLRAGKLYRSLAGEMVAGNTAAPSVGGAANVSAEFADAARITLLCRMIPEFELQHGELVASTKGSGKEGPRSWQRLWEALRHDDELWLPKLQGRLSIVGISPSQFAQRLLLATQISSPRAVATLVESMVILSPSYDLWKLAELPGINLNFLSALECEQRARNRVPTITFRQALIEEASCRPPDERSLQAFENRLSSAQESTKAAQSFPREETKGRPAAGDNVFRLPTNKELQDLRKQDADLNSDSKTENRPPTFGVSNTPVKRPKIPSWWIRCACPGDHPDAGLVFEGIRWHAPVLQCPNPELRRLEIK